MIIAIMTVLSSSKRMLRPHTFWFPIATGLISANKVYIQIKVYYGMLFLKSKVYVNKTVMGHC